MRVYVETGVDRAATAVWSFDLEHWGRCGRAPNETDAVAALLRITGERDAEVVERIDGDGQAFARDRVPANTEERQATSRILAIARSETVALVRGATPAQLDWLDAGSPVESASWATPGELAWHIADVESRYYLPAVGRPPRPRASKLLDELTVSAAFAVGALGLLPSRAIEERDGEVWTTVKVLRRLAWHEREHVAVLRDLLARAPR
jgi:hypothetical protein